MPKELTITKPVYKGRGKWSSITIRISTTGYILMLRKSGWVEVNHAFGKPVYVLLLETFVGPKPSPKHECCHKDDNRQNNNIKNLYWGTHAENMADAARNGKAYCPVKKVTSEKVTQAIELYRSGKTFEEVAVQMGLGYGTIHRWISGIVDVRKPDGGREKKLFKVTTYVERSLRQEYSIGKYSREEIGQMFHLTPKVVYRLTKDIKLCRNRKGRISQF